MKKLGWLVIESTCRPGCDVNTGPQQFWDLEDAEATAQEIRHEHADDPHYEVVVRRETEEDADRYGSYLG